MYQELANQLVNKRLNQSVETFPKNDAPNTEPEAYALQDQVVSLLCQHYQTQTCGYKLACTSEMARELLGASTPLSGQLLSHTTYENDANLSTDYFIHRIVEAEYVFEMAKDIDPNIEDYSSDNISGFIKTMRPGIEVVDHRFPDFTRAGPLALISDNAIHGVLVLGDPTYEWQNIDLGIHQPKLLVNDELVSIGSGSNVYGSPLNAMAWIANHLISRGKLLKAGDLVTTGVSCDIYHGQEGDRIFADFGQLGGVSCSFI